MKARAMQDAKALMRFSRWLLCIANFYLYIFVFILFSTYSDQLAGSDDTLSFSLEGRLCHRLKERNITIPDRRQHIGEIGQRITHLTQGNIEPSLDLSWQVAENEGPIPVNGVESRQKSGLASDPSLFEVDEQTVERALERTLVQTGVLLLPYGQAEIEPGFEYTRVERGLPMFITDGDMSFLGTENVQRSLFDIDLQVRLGLPYDSQFELGIPFRYVEESRFTPTITETEVNSHGKGFGDLRFGVAKTLAREGRWLPDFVVRMVWDSGFGKSRDNDIVLGSGFHELIGVLNAVKRQVK